MIIVYHIAGRVTSVQHLDGERKIFSHTKVPEALCQLATQYPTQFIVWCAAEARDNLNINKLPELFHHNRLMLSYGDVTRPYFTGDIGYIEDSPFLKVAPYVTYPTWQMHSYVGGTHAQVLLQVDSKKIGGVCFDFFLHTLSRKLQPQGLICLSEPKLLKDPESATSQQASLTELYTFVKQQYKLGWLFFLFFMHLRYAKKWPLFPLLKALASRKKEFVNSSMASIPFQSVKAMDDNFQVDVVIPTLGRASHLYNVLKDLQEQEIPPQKVIIVEQVAESNGLSQLDYLTQEKWPFTIDHTLIHTLGACNARNIALAKVSSSWVLLFDDDVRLKPPILKDLKQCVFQTGSRAITISCLQKDEVEKNITYLQWPTFGSCSSLVHKDLIDKLRFDTALEHGYGEDMDFGMQLRNLGTDILYAPQIQIKHLKAPIGGFRTSFSFPWIQDEILPKPSPQIMYHRIKNTTAQQLMGYKWVLFFKYYRQQPIKNPLSYVNYFKKAWNSSVLWSQKLPIHES